MKLLKLNETVVFETAFTQADLDSFSKTTGDHNPIHTEEYFHQHPENKGVIVHGLLVFSRFGAYLGSDDGFPGDGTINVSCSTQFLKPLFVGQSCLYQMTLIHVDTKHHSANMKLQVKTLAGNIIMEGHIEVINDKIFTIENYPAIEDAAIEIIQTIELPAPQEKSNITLHDALLSRRSIRYIQKTPIPIETLSNLLWSACGVSQIKIAKDGGKSYLFTNPTASNHQEVEVYVFTTDGVYRYNAIQHALQMLLKGDHRNELGKLPMYKMAPVSLCLVSNIGKMVHHTDENRSIYSCMDIGYVSQNIYLHCTANNLATCACGMIAHEGITTLLGLQESRVMLVHPIGLRKSNGL